MDEKKEVNVVEVCKPEEWPTALELRQNVTIQTARGPAELTVRALSFAEQLKIEEQFPDPTAPLVDVGGMQQPNELDPEYKRRRSENHYMTRVAVIDTCWQPLPGKTMQEKVDWCLKNIEREGEVYKIANAIDKLSGFGVQQDENEEEPQKILMTTPEEWAKATKAPVFFKLVHGKTKLKFKIQGLSGERIKEIRLQCDPGEPPREFKTLPNIPGGRRGIPIPNENSPAYVAKKKAKETLERTMFFDECLPFKIPGERYDQKNTWIEQRPFWEVLSMYSFIRGDNLSYRDNVDFSLGF